MKALRNPWVTGVLVVAAAATVAYQFMPSLSHAFQATARPAPAPAAPVPAPAPMRAEAEAPHAAAPAAAKPALPASTIDTNYGAAHLAEWADSPERDPFFLVPTLQVKPQHQYPSPVLKWKLKAIWRQTGGRVAAIDNGVYSEGDSIDGFKIEKIDGDAIWVQGPDKIERLGFHKLDPGVIANERPGAPPPNKGQPRS